LESEFLMSDAYYETLYTKTRKSLAVRDFWKKSFKSHKLQRQ